MAWTHQGSGRPGTPVADPVGSRPSTPGTPPLTPTGQRLKDLTADPDQLSVVPSRATQHTQMTPHQGRAANLFLENMDTADPTGRMRKRGEFFQTYRLEGGEVKANQPIHYEQGGAVDKPPKGSFPPDTFMVIHSHPPDYASNRPSSDDYFEAWKTKTNHGVEKEMLYDVKAGKFREFEGAFPPQFQTAHRPDSPSPGRARSSSVSSSSSESSSSSSDSGE